MPGPTPLPVRLTDKQRAELLLLREDDNSRLRARSHHYGVRRGGFRTTRLPGARTPPRRQWRGGAGPFVAMGAGVCEMRRARVARVLLLSFPMTSAKRCCATSAALRCRRASLPVPAS